LTRLVIPVMQIPISVIPSVDSSFHQTYFIQSNSCFAIFVPGGKTRQVCPHRAIQRNFGVRADKNRDLDKKQNG